VTKINPVTKTHPVTKTNPVLKAHPLIASHVPLRPSLATDLRPLGHHAE
jgi:hypothetical protein